MDDSGRPLALTSHTLAAVPIAIGGKGLPDGVVFRDDMPDAGMQLLSEGTCAFHSIVCQSDFSGDGPQAVSRASGLTNPCCQLLSTS